MAYPRLELVLLERAFIGVEKVIKRRDGSEERMIEYSNQLGLTLLKMHRDTAIEAAPSTEPDNIDEIRERLIQQARAVEEARGSKEQPSEPGAERRSDDAACEATRGSRRKIIDA